jgi:hypothetical protein
MFGIFQNRRRAKLLAVPLPPAWRGIIDHNVPLCARLPAALRRELEGKVQVFLDEKEFEGCAGQVIDDEIRVTIAANACLLLLNRETDYFPRMGSILVYPSGFHVKHRVVDEHGLEEVIEEESLGEAWERGSVILSWEDVRLDSQQPDDGFNVVIHEFAHQLDFEDGSPNGTPLLEDKTSYARWKAVMTREYEALCRVADRLDAADVETGEDWQWELRPRPAAEESVLDPYGAEDPAEFFAVATEAFFEDAVRLRSTHPELYTILAQFYRQDPASL